MFATPARTVRAVIMTAMLAATLSLVPSTSAYARVDRAVIGGGIGPFGGTWLCPTPLILTFSADQSTGPLTGSGSIRSLSSGATVVAFDITAGAIHDDSYVLIGNATTYACDFQSSASHQVKIMIKGECGTGDPNLVVPIQYRDTAGNATNISGGIEFAICT